MRFSKRIIIVMFATVFLFVIAMIATYWFKGGIPDTLVEQFFGFFGIEGGCLAVIKLGEALAERFGKDDKVKKEKKSADKRKKKGDKE